MRWFPRTAGRIRREAADWVARRGTAPDDVASSAEFQRWYRDSPRNAAAYDRIAAIWDAAGQVRSVTTGVPDHAAVPSRVWAYALAAMIFGAIVVVGALLAHPSPSTRAATRTIAATDLGVRLVQLPDGSRLTLDRHSSIRIDYAQDVRRIVLLGGRARFEVAHERRPFVVRAGDREILATGTVFDVSFSSGVPSVHLVEGAVLVRAAGGHAGQVGVRMRSGEILSFDPSGPVVHRALSSEDRSWPAPMLQFDALRLRDAVEQINRSSLVQVRLASSDLGTRKITGAFRAGDGAAFARGVAAALSLEVTSASNGDVVLSEPGRHAGTVVPPRR